MRKLLTILMAAFLAFGLTACESEDSSSPNKDSQKTESSVSEIELPEVKFD